MKSNKAEAYACSNPRFHAPDAAEHNPTSVIVVTTFDDGSVHTGVLMGDDVAASEAISLAAGLYGADPAVVEADSRIGRLPTVPLA